MNSQADRKPLELIDWSERCPHLTSRDIAILQSTRCLCGGPKEIGKFKCSKCEW